MAINSFGFGGANVHAVLEANQNRIAQHDSSTRLAVVCARTAEGCENILKQLKLSETNLELQALLNENSTHPSHTHPYRGYTLLNAIDSPMAVKVNFTQNNDTSKFRN